MDNKCKVITALSKDGGFRLLLVDSTAAVEKMRQLHNTSKTMTAALGRSITACSIMGKMLKSEKSSVTLRIDGGGPAGRIVCVADCEGNVRGCADNPDVELDPNEQGKLDVGGAVGKNGSIYIVKDLGFGEPYVGYSPIVSGEIAEDITEYYTVSEQTPSVCALGVRVFPDGTCKAAGGYILQLMPDANEFITPILQANIDYMPSLSQLIADGTSLEEIAGMIFGLVEFSVLEEGEFEYRCVCGKEKYAKALIGLGSDELKSMRDEGQPVEIVCQFCNTKYEFNTEELDELYKRAIARAEAAAAAAEENDEEE